MNDKDTVAADAAAPKVLPDEPLWDHKGNVRHEAVDRLGEKQRAAAQPDECAAFERCAQICEKWAQSIDTGKKRNRVVAAAIQGALTCAAAIRATAPQASGPKE